MANMKDEDIIEILCSNVIELINDLNIYFYDTKANRYITEHLILNMREIGYFFNKYFESELDDKLTSIINNIINCRDAIGHKFSDNNRLSNHMIIMGSWNFKNDDIEIQYGTNKILLVNGLMKLFIKFRDILLNPQINKDIDITWYTECRMKCETDINSLSGKIRTYSNNVFLGPLLRKYNLEEIVGNILHSAISNLFIAQPNIFDFSTETVETEWNFCHHLANEITKFIPWFDCDLELIKPNHDRKRPDIVFHKRGTNDSNLLVIEVKTNSEDIENDVDKIESHWINNLRYRVGAAIRIENSEKFHIILISAQGRKTYNDEEYKAISLDLSIPMVQEGLHELISEKMFE